MQWNMILDLSRETGLCYPGWISFQKKIKSIFILKEEYWAFKLHNAWNSSYFGELNNLHKKQLFLELWNLITQIAHFLVLVFLGSVEVEN